MRTIRPPLDRYLAELDGGLGGPARWRRRVLAEVADGLACAADSLTEQLGDRQLAERRAVAEWGPVAGLLEEFNAVGVQLRARSVARRVLLALPVLSVGWALVPLLSPVDPWPAEPPLVYAASRVLGLCLVVSVAACLLVLTDGRRAGPVRGRAGPPRALAVAGGGLLAGTLTVLALLLYRAHAAAGAVSWPLTIAPAGLTLLVLGVTGRDTHHLMVRA